MPVETRLFDYELPPEMIAQVPLENRDQSRLMVIHRDTGEIEHRRFSDVISYVRPRDIFILNDTRVFPARIFVKKKTGARIELLFLNPVDERKGLWRALARPGRRLSAGTELFHGAHDTPFCRLIEKHDEGEWTLEAAPRPLIPFLESHGIVPLPPYIKKTISDPSRYQTVYAERNGSAAAPTAGRCTLAACPWPSQRGPPFGTSSPRWAPIRRPSATSSPRAAAGTARSTARRRTES